VGYYSDRLRARLARSTTWPLPADEDVWERIELWQALRESDREYLEDFVEWDPGLDNRKYIIDPLAPQIDGAYASLSYGRRPTFTPANEADDARLTFLVEENQTGSELQRMAHLRSSEGQAWWRWVCDHMANDCPMLEWHSRTAVVPLWVGKKLKAVGFFTRLDPIEDSSGHENKARVYRHFELHDDLDVTNVLFVGTDRTLGREVDLTDHPETEDLRAEPWVHGMPRMIAGRVVNRYGTDVREGRSDYDGIEDLLLALNESRSIAHENTRLAGKKRLVAPESALDENGQLPAGAEVLVAETVADTAALGEEGKQQGAAAMFKVLEYGYDPTAIAAYQQSLVVTALSRIGITPQFVGIPVDGEGSAETGVALRLRLVPSINAGNDRNQDADTQLPLVFELGQLLDAADPVQDGAQQVGGWGRPWVDPTDPPTIERGTALPEDRTEETDRHVTAVTGEIESRQTAIEEMHPDWDKDRVAEEVNRIRAELKWATPTGLGSLLRDTAPPDGEQTNQDNPPGGDPAKAQPVPAAA
jgi:hypothetical protein